MSVQDLQELEATDIDLNIGIYAVSTVSYFFCG